MLGKVGDEGKNQMQNEERYYLRYHNAISRAIELNKEIFGNKVGKDGKEPMFEHSLRVAGMVEEILDQTMQEYHLGWLLGILHDNKEHKPDIYASKIDWVIEDLLPPEKQKILKYINELSSNKQLPKGQQKREQLQKVKKMDLIPTWILLFDKYDNCRRFKQNPCGKSMQELKGYYSVAFLIYIEARKRHTQISKFMINETKSFFEELGRGVGGDNEARRLAEKYFVMMK